MNNPNWISVDDRWPENGQSVISFDDKGREIDSTFYFHENRGNRPYFHVKGRVWEHSDVIQWMPRDK